MLAERTPTQGQIDRQASAWLARQRMTRLTPAEAAQFEAWLAADPRHEETFEAMGYALEDVAALDQLAELEPLTPPRPRWRAPAFGAIAAALAALFVAPVLLDRPDIAASTLVAEIRPIVLPDGTKVTLGARSEIKADFTGGERRVRLTRGEAFFEIAENDARPFVVDAGGTEIRDIGTSFDVKRTHGRVQVAVLEGIVEVRPHRLIGEAPVRRLEAGQRVRARATGIGPLVATATVGAVETAPAEAGAWRAGQLTYDDTRLADLVADLNRYYAPGVSLDSAGLGDIRLAASFKAHEIDKFLAELPSAAPVRVQRGGDGAVVITRRERAPAAG